MLIQGMEAAIALDLWAPVEARASLHETLTQLENVPGAKPGLHEKIAAVRGLLDHYYGDGSPEVSPTRNPAFLLTGLGMLRMIVEKGGLS